ncbi:MAG: thioredoxin family protein [Promethearchaeota archaeon]
MMKIHDGIISISSIDAFNKIVNNYMENIIIVDIYADWCIPCKSFLPIYKRAQQNYHQKGVIFTRLNIDYFPEVAEQFGIQGVPALILIKNKKGLKRHVGALRMPQLKKLIDTYL